MFELVLETLLNCYRICGLPVFILFIKYSCFGNLESPSSLDLTECDRITDLNMEMAAQIAALARSEYILDYTLYIYHLAKRFQPTATSKH